VIQLLLAMIIALMFLYLHFSVIALRNFVSRFNKRILHIVLRRFENLMHSLLVRWFAREGAVCYGLEPGVVTTRRSGLTYGVEVLNRFDAGRHPQSKKIHKDGVDWCTAVFDTFVHANQVWLAVYVPTDAT